MNSLKLRLVLLTAFGSLLVVGTTDGQTQCDPTKVVTAEKCAQCHANEVQVWRQTPHFRTFQELGRRAEAKEICDKLGLRSVKRSDLCTDCHFTTKVKDNRLKPVSGISCESCHGAAKEWLHIHSDYGGPTATKESESDAHREQRWADSIAAGMNNTREIYLIARNCFGCHTVPNEKLVNVGGHTTGSQDFELVAWSQGQVRHNFLRTQGSTNGKSDQARLRVMFVAGKIAELEFSTRAVACATERSEFGVAVANRAARSAVRLYELQQDIQNPDIQSALEAFATAQLKINNKQQLLSIADQIMQAGIRFTHNEDGSALSVIDSHLPDPSQYK